MEAADLVTRNVTYGLFLAFGHAPTADSVASALGTTRDEVRAAWRRLEDEHALVLEPRTPEIRMANPLSAVPSAYRVNAAGRWWYANCAWDAFGVCAALQVDGRIEASCPDCGEPISVEVHDGRSDTESLLFHCLVPAAQWWDDIVFA
jgi:hypothetical protein